MYASIAILGSYACLDNHVKPEFVLCDPTESIIISYAFHPIQKFTFVYSSYTQPHIIKLISKTILIESI